MQIKAALVGMDALQKSMQRIADQTSRQMEAVVRSGALLVQNSAKTKAPFKTGTYRRSIHMETATRLPTEVVVHVGTNDPRGPWLEYGTGVYSEAPGAKKQPIVIRPKNKKALAFKGQMTFAGTAFIPASSGMGTVIVKKVVQQGQHAKPHFRPAIDENGDRVLEEMRKALADLVAKGLI